MWVSHSLLGLVIYHLILTTYYLLCFHLCCFPSWRQFSQRCYSSVPEGYLLLYILYSVIYLIFCYISYIYYIILSCLEWLKQYEILFYLYQGVKGVRGEEAVRKVQLIDLIVRYFFSSDKQSKKSSCDQTMTFAYLGLFIRYISHEKQRNYFTSPWLITKISFFLVISWKIWEI